MADSSNSIVAQHETSIRAFWKDSTFPNERTKIAETMKYCGFDNREQSEALEYAIKALIKTKKDTL